MRDIIDLQAHMAQVSRKRLLASGELIKYCREKLSESVATLNGIDDAQQHIDTVGALVKQYLTVECEDGAVAKQLRVLEIEVNKEMAMARFAPPPGNTACAVKGSI